MDKLYTRRQAVDLLKVVAIFMVLNSHFDSLYPNSAFASGGAAANSLFFIISGFFCSIRGPKKTWIFNKLIKLYLPVWIITCLKFFFVGIPTNFYRFIAKFTWPTDYWFISALMSFYLVFLILKSIRIEDNIKVISAFFLIIYFVFYFIYVSGEGLDVEETNFKLIYYCYIFLLGTWLRKNHNKIVIHAYILFPCGIISFLGSMVLRLLLKKELIPASLEFLSQFMNIVFAFTMLLTSLECETVYALKASTYLKKIVIFLSSISLEMYIVQFDVINWFTPIKFPINIVGTIVVTIVLAFILNRIVSIIKSLGKHCYIEIVK